jgi:Uma2 family endonuclease
MATTSALMTVEQFRELPEPKEGYYELHHGEPVLMTRPKHRHASIQRRLAIRLQSVLGDAWVVWPEFSFRPTREHQLWTADVACVTSERWDAIELDDNLHGAPELVIEVLSPSNSASEINEREAMCLENGCREFWVVDPKTKTVRVATPDRKSIAYIEGEKIPLTLLGGGELAVSEIFA